MTESTAVKVKLRFIFANRDGISREKSFAMSTSVGKVKRWLRKHWPSAAEECPSDASRMRLICMGIFMNVDEKTLADYRVKSFANPTPVNVTVRPAGMKESRHHAASVGEFRAPNSGASAQPGSRRSCCVVS